MPRSRPWHLGLLANLRGHMEHCIPGQGVRSDLGRVPEHLDGRLVTSLCQICKEPNVGSGMVSLKEMSKLGSHLFCTVTNTYTVALIVNSQELIVC